MKKKPVILIALDTVKAFWPLLVVLFGIVGTIVTIPSRLTATEKKTDSLEQRQNKTDQYIDAIEEQKALIHKSPPGWQWNETTQSYIVWKDDPRLKKK